MYVTFFFPLPFPNGTKREARHGGRETGRKAGKEGGKKGGKKKGGGGQKKKLKLPEYRLEPVDVLSVNPLYALVSYFYGGDYFITS